MLLIALTIPKVRKKIIHVHVHGGVDGLESVDSINSSPGVMRWGFADGRGLLNIFCSDIFQTRMISPVIDYGGQYVHTRYKGWRRAGVALTWKFGGYTEKRREAVDTGRFR